MANNVGPQIAQGIRKQTPCYFIFKIGNVSIIPDYLPKGWDSSITVSRNPNNIFDFQSSFIEKMEVYGSERDAIKKEFKKNRLLSKVGVEFWQVDKFLSESLVFSGEIDFDSLADKDNILSFTVIEKGKYRNYINNLNTEFDLAQGLNLSKIKTFGVTKKNVLHVYASFKDHYTLGDQDMPNIDSALTDTTTIENTYDSLGLGIFTAKAPEISELENVFFTSDSQPYTSLKSISMTNFIFNSRVYGSGYGTGGSGGLGCTLSISIRIKNNIGEEIEISKVKVRYYANKNKGGGDYAVFVRIINGVLSFDGSETLDITTIEYVKPSDYTYFLIPPTSDRKYTEYSIGYYFGYEFDGGQDDKRMRNHELNCEYTQNEDNFKIGYDSNIRGTDVKSLISQMANKLSFNINFGGYSSILERLHYSNDSLFNNRLDLPIVITEKISNFWLFLANALAIIPKIDYNSATDVLNISLVPVNDALYSGSDFEIIPINEVSLKANTSSNIKSITFGNDYNPKDKSAGLIEPCSKLTAKASDLLKSNKPLEIPFSLSGVEMSNFSTEVAESDVDVSNTETVKLNKPFIFDTENNEIKTFTYGDSGSPEKLYGYFINEMFNKNNLRTRLMPLLAAYSQTTSLQLQPSSTLSVSDNNANNIVAFISEKRLEPAILECKVVVSEQTNEFLKSGNLTSKAAYKGNKVLVTKCAHNYSENLVLLNFTELI